MAALAEFLAEDQARESGLMTLRLRLVEMPIAITARTPTPLSDEQLMQFSQANELYRVERNRDGDLEIMSPQGGQGARGESYLIRMLDEWAERHGGASFSSQGGFHLPDGSVRMADACWVEEQRWNALSEAEKNVYPPLCPDFVIELLSPSDSRAALESKMQLWLENGARLAWLIDPRAGEVMISRAAAEPERLIRPADVEAKDVVTGFRVDLSRFWS